MIADQEEIWDRAHAAGDHVKFGAEPRQFALEVVKDLSPSIKLLELGCGIGNDARFFAQQGISVLATDFSKVVIEQNKQKGEGDNLRFETLDIAKPFAFQDASFDVVYSHLALHYYSEPVTNAIFKEIARLLVPGGKLYFTCKSVADPKYGDGEEIGPDIFMRHGHIRHFFSEDYMKFLLEEDYKILHLSESTATYIGERSAFIECWAQKKEG